MTIHALLWISTSHHGLLVTISLLIASVLLRRPRRTTTAKLRRDLREKTALLFARWQLALLAVRTRAASAVLL
jgi:hypothetical protein